LRSSPPPRRTPARSRCEFFPVNPPRLRGPSHSIPRRLPARTNLVLDIFPISLPPVSPAKKEIFPCSSPSPPCLNVLQVPGKTPPFPFRRTFSFFPVFFPSSFFPRAAKPYLVANPKQPDDSILGEVYTFPPLFPCFELTGPPPPFTPIRSALTLALLPPTLHVGTLAMLLDESFFRFDFFNCSNPSFFFQFRRRFSHRPRPPVFSPVNLPDFF